MSQKHSNRRWPWLVVMATGGMLLLAACSGGATATPTGEAPLPPTGNSASSPPDVEAARLASLAALGSGSQQVGLWVSGAGSVLAEPDLAVLSFGVEARADMVAPALTRAAEAMDAVIASLRARGVQERDIQTRSFGIQPITVFRDVLEGGVRERRPEIVGYTVSNSATAKIRDLDSAGAIIDAAATAGGDAIRINGISFTIEDPKPLEQRARELALQDAMVKAQQMAQVAGIRLGALLSITESGGSPVVQQDFSRAEVAGASSTTPISAGEMQITIRVQMVYAIG